MSEPRLVVLAEPDPGWVSEFERERAAIEVAVAGLWRVWIEHIGSTAVQGIRAKPIIDILLGIESHEVFDRLRALLESLGYQYDAGASSYEADRRVFRKGPSDHALPRTHHVHVTLAGGRNWSRLLAFRDYLRADPKVAEEYERLKMGLARMHAEDGDAYTRGKGAFVRRVERLAAVVERQGGSPPVGADGPQA